MAKTGVREKITLACTECKRRNYESMKSKRNTPDRVELQEVLPLVRPSHAAQGDAMIVGKDRRYRLCGCRSGVVIVGSTEIINERRYRLCRCRSGA